MQRGGDDNYQLKCRHCSNAVKGAFKYISDISGKLPRQFIQNKTAIMWKMWCGRKEHNDPFVTNIWANKSRFNQGSLKEMLSIRINGSFENISEYYKTIKMIWKYLFFFLIYFPPLPYTNLEVKCLSLWTLLLVDTEPPIIK